MEAVSTRGNRSDAKSEPADMSQPQLATRWIRAGGIAGILAFVAILATKPVGGASLINANSTAAQIASNLGAHPNRTLTSNALTITALALGLWFGATVAHLVGERDKTSPLGALILTGAICIFIAGALDAVTQSALVLLAKEDSLTASPQLTRLVYILYDGPIQPGIMGIAIAIFLTAISAAALQRTIARRWVGWLSLIFALTAVVGAIQGLTVTNGGNLAPGALGLLGDILITVIAGTYLLREPTNSRGTISSTRYGKVHPG